MTKDEELAKYMAQIEQYKEQINTLEMQNSYLQAAIADYNKAKITLEQLDKTDKNTPEQVYCNEYNIDIVFQVGGGKVQSSS